VTARVCRFRVGSFVVGVMREMGGWSTQKEVVGGYAIVDVASPEEAVALGRRFLEIHREILGPEYELSSEIHRLYSPSDFAPPAQG
jgi:hypothetical protein